ncbi:Tim44 domain-containing protein [Sutterella megalosphaeroides]|uniref:Membrane protein n=1 Tax=Sutterella megalosphaeroides TaxID=2494234 RepID=A0A2Z6IB51_9BURK|nr:TIM44-like domain-containing protein [Sutterella megalosphaeroides]BBF22338.1 membrane protein [Sutterella megalosphaeroides]
MKNFLAALVVCVALAATSFDAEAARRFGGGSNLGNRSVPTFSQKAAPNAAPQAPAGQMRGQNATPNRATPAQQAPVQKPSMMRSVLTGLAAALGISALLSLLGINGAGMVSFVMGLLLVVAAFMAVRFFLARRAPAAASGGHAPETRASETVMRRAPVDTNASTTSTVSAASGAAAGSVMDQFTRGARVEEPGAAVDVTPADFDREAFLKTARDNYVLLQKAWDTGNVVEISDFTTEDVFIAITHQLRERGHETYRTEVVELSNELLGIACENGEYLASVRFVGTLRINGEDESVDETWLLVKPVEGKGGWLLGAIKQNETPN